MLRGLAARVTGIRRCMTLTIRLICDAETQCQRFAKMQHPNLCRPIYATRSRRSRAPMEHLRSRLPLLPRQGIGVTI